MKNNKSTNGASLTQRPFEKKRPSSDERF